MAKAEADRKKKLDVFKQQIVAVCALNPLTIEGAAKALNTRLGFQQQLSQARTEWPIEPTEVIRLGLATRFGPDTMVEITPTPALELSFEDLAALFMDTPYDWDVREGHHGDLDSVATRVFATDHVFKVPAGTLRLHFPYKVPAEDPEHFTRAIKEAAATARGTHPGKVLVESLTVSTMGPVTVRLGRTLREWRMARKPAGP